MRYALDGWPRKIVKRGFNILINAESHDSARRAIALAIGGQGSYAKAVSLIEAIKLRHQQEDRDGRRRDQAPAPKEDGRPGEERARAGRPTLRTLPSVGRLYRNVLE